MAAERIQIPVPDDWHIHFRDDALLATTVPTTAAVFGRAVVMPNLVPPVTSVAAAMAYRERILDVLPAESAFDPLMAIYLTQATTVADVIAAAKNNHVIGFKLYPSGATTNSAAGVTSLPDLAPVFEAMETHHVPLLVHGEVTDSDIDIFDREKIFIERNLAPLVEKHPNLKLILEHITTADAVDFVKNANKNVAATITPQHLLMNRNHLLVGGIRPHNYCLPVLKRREHQLALQQIVLSGNPKFFLGTDSAPHARDRKEAPCGCAGCYSAPAALPLYAEFFEQNDAMHLLANFAAGFGADFYGLPRHARQIELVKTPWQVPASIDTEVGPITPYWAEETLQWQVAE